MAPEKVKSSVIASVKYDDDRSVLEITFHTGRVYHYSNVPRGVYEELLTAESAGKYFNDVIRTGSDAELVYDPQRPRIRT